MFYRFQISVKNEFSTILNGGRLFQQYCVDSYVKVEANRIRFIQMNQTQLRVENYTGLMDYLNDK